MKVVPIFNKEALGLAGIGFCLLILFAVWGYKSNAKWLPENKDPLAIERTAYAIYKHNSFFYWYDSPLRFENDILVATKPSSNDPVGHHLITESVGFSVLLGLLWTLTGTPSIFHMQGLCIVLFTLFILLIYQIGYFLFRSRQLAKLSTISFLGFLPLIFNAVQGRKDTFAFFGIALLLFIVLRVIYQTKSTKEALLGGVGVALFQWIRTPLVAVVLAVSGILLGYYFYNRKKEYKNVVISLLLMNVLIFWIPFLSYNQYYYKRPLVGVLGHNLLQGLAEYPNEWNAEATDTWSINFTKKRKNPSVSYGVPEHDDIEKELFFELLQEKPWYYSKCILKRIQKLLFLSFTWFEYDHNLYQGKTSFKEKFLLSLKDWRIAIDFFPRTFYMRLFWISAYLGMCFALFRRKYFLLIMLIGGIMAPMPMVIFSHIEDRYVLVHFWVLCFFVAYAFDQVYYVYKSSNCFKKCHSKINLVKV